MASSTSLFRQFTANPTPQLDTFSYEVQQKILTEMQRSQQRDQRITELKPPLITLSTQRVE